MAARLLHGVTDGFQPCKDENQNGCLPRNAETCNVGRRMAKQQVKSRSYCQYFTAVIKMALQHAKLAHGISDSSKLIDLGNKWIRMFTMAPTETEYGYQAAIRPNKDISS